MKVCHNADCGYAAVRTIIDKMSVINDLRLTADALPSVETLLSAATMYVRFSRRLPLQRQVPTGRLAVCALVILFMASACGAKDPELAKREHARRGDEY